MQCDNLKFEDEQIFVGILVYSGGNLLIREYSRAAVVAQLIHSHRKSTPKWIILLFHVEVESLISHDFRVLSWAIK